MLVSFTTFCFFIFQNKKLIINLIDDLHNVHTVHTPSELKLSFATHMTSNLLDILDIPAVPLPSNRQNIHSTTTIKVKGTDKIVRGGIVPSYIKHIMTNGMKYFHIPYFDTLPNKYQQLKPKNTRKQLEEFR